MSNSTYNRQSRKQTPATSKSLNTRPSSKGSKSKNNYLKQTATVSLRIAQLVLHIALIVLFYVAVIAAFSKVATLAYDFSYPIFGNVAVETSPGTNVEIVIEEEDNLREIAKKLSEKNLIKNEYSFYIRSLLSINERRAIVPGVYTLNTSQDYGTILNILTQSDVIEH